MATHNDITGDAIKSKATNDKFRSGYELAFGKKQKPCYNESSPVGPEADGVGTGGKERSRTTEAV